MNIELDKKGFVDLLMGASPHYDLFENELVKKCGNYNGSYGTWSWNTDKLLECSEIELYNLYKLCKNSWE